MFLLLIYSVIIISFAQENNQQDLVSVLRQNPIFVFFLVLTLALWFFFLMRGNTRSELMFFLKNHFLKYVAKFMAFVITSYLAYFVLISHKNEDFVDIIIEMVLALSAFVLFLFASWFEESDNPPITKDHLKRTGSIILRALISILVPLLLFFLIYNFIFSLDKVSSSLISFLQTSLLIVGFSPFIKSRVKRVAFVIFIWIVQLGFLMWMKAYPEFMLNNGLIYWTSAIGLLAAMGSFIFSISFENKSWFKWFCKDLFDPVD